MERLKRVLVTGVTGFTGSHLCERLAKGGYLVRALVREPKQGLEFSEWGVEMAVGDLRDLKSLQKAMKGVDVVYHIAALFRPENVSRNDMWETNVQGTKNMLEAALDA